MISKNPLPIDLAQLGVKRQQFAHTSAVHGPEHVNRVIYLAMTIARLQGFASLMPEVWASAYLHDLARTRDGVCHEHGRHAISLIPQYTELLHRAGVRDIQAVAHAIDVHARPVRAQHPVAAILKDADSLDRVRIGDFDPRFLHLERSHSIAPLAHKLWLATDGEDDWMTIWDAAVQIFNPHSGIASRTPGDWNAHESGRERMLRRLCQGEQPNRFDKIARLVPSEILPDIDFTPVIDMRPESWAKVQASGTFLSFWELFDAGALTWHNQFTDNPEDARAYSERRLFGERCRRTFYGVLQNPMLAASDPVLRSMYGQVRVTLKPDVLDAASFTLADSQSNAWALPYDAQTVKTMLFAWFVGQREAYMASLLPTQEPMRYVEIQIHRPLTLADVYAVDKENSYEPQEMPLHAPIPA